MTLYRQIVLFLSILFLIIFCGIFIISTVNTRTFLSEQLEVDAGNTANSMGLALSIPLKTNDKAYMLSMVNAILESGYYKDIQILDINNKTVIDRYIEGYSKHVPQWFIKLFPLPNPIGKALVMDGWIQKGTVVVTSSSGLAYFNLWRTSTALFWWFLTIYILALLLSFCIIKVLLRPLYAIRKQAEAIANRQFPLQKSLPRTYELRLVAETMNTMTSKVKKMFKKDTFLIENLHKKAYQDPVTNLGNRRYFDTQLQHLISEETIIGALLLIELQGLKQYDDTEGYQAGDELIRRLGDVVKDNCQDIKKNFLARISGGTFAILTPNLSEEEVSHLATGLIHAIEESLGELAESKHILAHIGIASLAGVKDASQVLSFADMALRTAQSKGSYAFYRHENENEALSEITIRTASEWKKYIEHIIDEDLVTVVYQPVMRFPDKTIMSYEALLRVKGIDGHLTTAKFIIPMADRYSLTHALDQCVIKQVITKLKDINTDIPYVINLSASTLTHEPTLQWLFKTLSTGEYRNKLIFELGEHTVLNNLDLVKNMLKQLRQYGVELGIEHYGHGFSGFGYLKSLHLLYLKIDGSYIRDLDNQDTQFFINFLTKIAHTLDIKVIAECVETEAQWDLLQSFQLDGAQGLFLAPPEQ